MAHKHSHPLVLSLRQRQDEEIDASEHFEWTLDDTYSTHPSMPKSTVDSYLESLSSSETKIDTGSKAQGRSNGRGRESATTVSSVECGIERKSKVDCQNAESKARSQIMSNKSAKEVTISEQEEVDFFDISRAPVPPSIVKQDPPSSHKKRPTLATQQQFFDAVSEQQDAGDGKSSKDGSSMSHERHISNVTAIWNPRSDSEETIRPSAKQVSPKATCDCCRANQAPLTPPSSPKFSERVDSPLAGQSDTEARPSTSLSRIAPYAKFDPPKNDGEVSRPATSSSREDCLPRHIHISRSSSIASSKRSRPTRPPSSQRSLSSTTSHPPRSSFSFDLDADLDPLPPDLCNDPDFASIFYVGEAPDHSWASAHWTTPQHARFGSSTTSFDSVAPPPIGISARHPHPKQTHTTSSNAPGKRSKHIFAPNSTAFQTTISASNALSTRKPLLHRAREAKSKTKGFPYENTLQRAPPLLVAGTMHTNTGVGSTIMSASQASSQALTVPDLSRSIPSASSGRQTPLSTASARTPGMWNSGPAWAPWDEPELRPRTANGKDDHYEQVDVAGRKRFGFPYSSYAVS